MYTHNILAAAGVRHREEDHCELKTSLVYVASSQGYTVRPCQYINMHK